MTDQERELSLRQIDATIANLNAETAKLHAETSKLTSENRWYVAVVASGVTLAIVAVARLFL